MLSFNTYYIQLICKFYSYSIDYLEAGIFRQWLDLRLEPRHSMPTEKLCKFISMTMSASFWSQTFSHLFHFKHENRIILFTNIFIIPTYSFNHVIVITLKSIFACWSKCSFGFRSKCHLLLTLNNLQYWVCVFLKILRQWIGKHCYIKNIFHTTSQWPGLKLIHPTKSVNVMEIFKLNKHLSKKKGIV